MLDKEYTQKHVDEARFLFSDYKVSAKSCDGMTVIDWNNGTSNWAVRYILDGECLIVTGDIGCAVFERPGRFDLDFCRGITKSMFYLAEKCRADGSDVRYSGIFEWNPDSIKADLDKYFESFPRDYELGDEGKSLLGDIKEELIKSVRNKGPVVTREIQYMLDELTDNSLCWEDYVNIEECGKQYSLFYIAWLVGLEMAAEMLG